MNRFRLDRRVRGFAAYTVLCAGALLLGAGCHQDMWNQPKYKPLTAAPLFADMQSTRPLVAGTVPYKGARVDDHLYKGKEGDQFASTIPFPITEAFLKRGQERYTIFCAVCHGDLGYGGNTAFVASRGFDAKKPANFHEQRLRDVAPGYLFDVITNGFGTMYGYASRIPNVEDRWAIVAYVNVLQYSQNAPISDLPEDKRNMLDLTAPADPTQPDWKNLEVNQRLKTYLTLTGQLAAGHGEGHGSEDGSAH